MKTNENLQKDVQNALKWEPLLNAAEIGVTVKDGVVTLTGVVDSYIKKTEAEHAAKNVAGVKAIVEKIIVKISDNWGKKDDSQIASEIVNALKWNWQVPDNKIKVKVEEGWVTLEGELPWNSQKDAAKNAVKNLLGVVGVSNNITIRPEFSIDIQKSSVENALERNSSLYDLKITVSISGHTATLTGNVDSYYQKEEAGRVAWNAPGVWHVDNELVVEYDYDLVG